MRAGSFSNPTTTDQAVYQTAPRIPVRGSLMMPNGSVMRIPLVNGRPDAFSIIAALQMVIDQYGRTPEVRNSALALINSRVNNDVRANAQRIFRWVVNSMVYLADPDGAEFVQTPSVLLRQIQSKGRAYGDCDDHVVLLGALLVSIGIPARVAGVKLFGGDLFNHVVIEIPQNGQWVVLDPCAKQTATPKYGERLVAAG